MITTEPPRLTDNQMVREITDTPSYRRVWLKCSADQRRRVLQMADGDPGFLKIVFEDIEDEISDGGAS